MNVAIFGSTFPMLKHSSGIISIIEFSRFYGLLHTFIAKDSNIEFIHTCPKNKDMM
jgi:hypothetical protein